MRLLEIHLEVEDIDRSTTFYQALLPYHKLTRWQDGSAVAFVLEDGAAFGLWKKGKRGLHNGQGGQHVHFAFQIAPEEYDKHKSKLEMVGVEILEHRWNNGHRSLYFFDPDGHQGEFMTCDWIAL